MNKLRAIEPGWESEGIVIRAYPYRDADLVLRVVTKGLGKVSVLARGTRKNRKAHHAFDTFDRGLFTLYQGRGSLLLIDSFVAGPALRPVRSDLDKLTLSSIISEAFDFLIKEGAGDNDSVFNTLSLSLEAIEESGNIREALKASYYSLSNLMCISGEASRTSTGPSEAPSPKKLLELLDKIEDLSSRPFQSKTPLLEVLRRLKNAS